MHRVLTVLQKLQTSEVIIVATKNAWEREKKRVDKGRMIAIIMFSAVLATHCNY